MSCTNIKLLLDSQGITSSNNIYANDNEDLKNVEEINYDHIFVKYYWTIVVLIAINILLFFLILVLLYILK